MILLFLSLLVSLSVNAATTTTAANNPYTQLGGRAVSFVAPTGGYVLTWNSTSNVWEPAAAGGGAPTPWFIGASLGGGATIDLGTSDISSYTEMTNAGMTLTPITGSAAAGIMCSGGNAATAPSTGATTCAAGSESVGINFSLPTAAMYEVCGQFQWDTIVDDGFTIAIAFEWIQTPTNAQTISLEGGGRLASTIIGAAANNHLGLPQHNCSIFDWSAQSPGTTIAVRMMYEQVTGGGTPDNSRIFADDLAPVGQRNFYISVKRLY